MIASKDKAHSNMSLLLSIVCFVDEASVNSGIKLYTNS